MNHFIVVVAVFIVAVRNCTAEIPALSPAAQSAVDIAVDDRDWNDAAFAALVENARLWREPVGDVQVRNNPDFARMLESPESYRGDLCVVRGVLQQHNRLPEPFTDVSEWFIRDDAGRPIQVFVVMPEVATRTVTFRDGSPVEVLGRFYKRTVESDTLTGEMHYPAFVGALPKPTSGSKASDLPFPAWLPMALIAMLAVFAVLFVRVRRLRKSKRRDGLERSRFAERDDAVEEVPLPENPADALAELRRRAGD